MFSIKLFSELLNSNNVEFRTFSQNFSINFFPRNCLKLIINCININSMKYVQYKEIDNAEIFIILRVTF